MADQLKYFLEENYHHIVVVINIEVKTVEGENVYIVIQDVLDVMVEVNINVQDVAGDLDNYKEIHVYVKMEPIKMGRVVITVMISV